MNRGICHRCGGRWSRCWKCQAATLRELLGRFSLCSETPSIGEKPTLTDDEREAVSYYVGTGGPDGVDATLVALLERMA